MVKEVKNPNKDLKAIKSDVSPEEVKTTAISAAVDDRFKEVEGKIEFVRNIMYFAIIFLLAALATTLIAATIAYFQFVKDANIEYKNTVTDFNNTVKQYNDERYKNLQDKINVLEGKLTNQPTK